MTLRCLKRVVTGGSCPDRGAVSPDKFSQTVVQSCWQSIGLTDEITSFNSCELGILNRLQTIKKIKPHIRTVKLSV